jgi:hypothetical protein
MGAKKCRCTAPKTGVLPAKTLRGGGIGTGRIALGEPLESKITTILI